MTIGVVVFPGSNCDRDCLHVLAEVCREKVRPVWHKESALDGLEAVVLPGGFSYGDYLRTGAIARFSPIMGAIERFARNGGLVLGICNGFQILLEAGLLPGAMLRNRSLAFICKDVQVRVENTGTPFTFRCKPGQVLTLPIAHAEGNYFADPATLAKLKAGNRIVFRYCTSDGAVTPEANPNGSLENIAGIINEAGNVLGLMPHPERCAESVLGNEAGRLIFQSMLDKLKNAKQQTRTVMAR